MPKSDDMTTFADLGLSFPLFEAPVRACATFVGPKICHSCGVERHYFREVSNIFWLGSCLGCGTQNRRTIAEGHFSGSEFEWSCSTCEAMLDSRILQWTEEKHLICFGCVQQQEVKFPKETEFGTVDSDAVIAGVTGGIPGLTATDGFDLVTVNENWNDAELPDERVVSSGVRIAPEHLRELLRTPRYFGWQDERWLFCCGRLMIFLGYWFDDIRVLGPRDRGELFRRICQTDPDYAVAPSDDWLAASHDFDGNSPEMYVFRCVDCEQLRCYVDCC